MAERPLVLCLHETGTSGRIWAPLAEALSGHAEVLAPDRPGWGGADIPEGYERTTIPEQAGFAAQTLRERGPAVVCGAGIGAVATLELSLGEPDLITGAVVVEPPLLSFIPEATDQLAADVALVRETVAAGGREAALDAFLAGRMPALGPGAGRIPPDYAELAPPRRPRSSPSSRRYQRGSAPMRSLRPRPGRLSSRPRPTHLVPQELGVESLASPRPLGPA